MSGIRYISSCLSAATPASRCTAGLEGISESGLPVARTAPAMSDCDDLNFVITSDVDQAEGKPQEDVAPCTTPIAGPSVRALGDGFDCVPQFVAKAVCRG